MSATDIITCVAAIIALIIALGIMYGVHCRNRALNNEDEDLSSLIGE